MAFGKEDPGNETYCIMAKVLGESKLSILTSDIYRGMSKQEAYSLANKLNERAANCNSVSYFIPELE